MSSEVKRVTKEVEVLDPQRVAEITISERPHMPEASVAYLESRLKISKCYLEYGSGGSTRMAAAIGVPRVFSVESDKHFAEAVRLAAAKEKGGSTIFVHTADVGETGAWGMPTSTEAAKLWPDYALGIWKFISKAKASPDLVLIDGRFRVACFLASVMSTRPGTQILMDDYVGREKRYSRVEAIVPLKQTVSRMAVFETPESYDPRALAEALARAVLDPR